MLRHVEGIFNYYSTDLRKKISSFYSNNLQDFFLIFLDRRKMEEEEEFVLCQVDTN